MPHTRRTRAWTYAGSVALLAVITWVDYATGYELGLFVFYFIPVGLAAWYGSRAAGLTFAVAAAACWYIADRLALHPYSNALFIYWETFMRLVSYFTTALTLASIRRHVREREDLLHVVSHDLRAPLASVVGQAQILRRRAPDDAWVAARADAILRAASRMDAMVEDLLDSARLESGRLRLALERVNLEEFLDELFARLGTSLEVERVSVSVPRSEGITLDVDPRRLERVLVNLLSNALKFCPEGAVRLAAERRSGWVTISVSDDGPGIDPADVTNLFTRYHQARRSPSRDGIGLGLYGARLLVEAHGGRISAESTPGAGSTFRVELPDVSAGRSR
jgi:signal transduction histidine kinase